MCMFENIFAGHFNLIHALSDRCEGFGLYMSGSEVYFGPTVGIFVKEEAKYARVGFSEGCKASIGTKGDGLTGYLWSIYCSPISINESPTCAALSSYHVLKHLLFQSSRRSNLSI